MVDYKCLECDEKFEYEAHCVLHNMNTKHEKFEIIETDIKINIKS